MRRVNERASRQEFGKINEKGFEILNPCSQRQARDFTCNEKDRYVLLEIVSGYFEIKRRIPQL